MRKSYGYSLIRVDGETIPYTSQTKIIRVTFDNNITFHNQTNERKKQKKNTLN